MRYDRLLSNWKEVASRVSRDLEISWPRWSDETMVEIESFLLSRHRHHKWATDELDVRGDVVAWVKRAYSALTRLEDDVKAPAATLDAIRTELDTADVAFGPVIAAARVSVCERDLEIRRLTGDLSARQSDVESLHDAMQARDRATATQQSEVAREIEGLQSTAATTAADHRQQLMVLRSETQHRHDQVRQLQDDLEAMRNKGMSWNSCRPRKRAC